VASLFIAGTAPVVVTNDDVNVIVELDGLQQQQQQQVTNAYMG